MEERKPKNHRRKEGKRKECDGREMVKGRKGRTAARTGRTRERTWEGSEERAGKREDKGMAGKGKNE